MKAKVSIFLFGLTFLTFLVLSSSTVSADETTTVTANATVTVGSACTLSSNVSSAHTATIPSGTNQSEIGSTVFTMTCNDTGGYSIYAVGYSGFEVGNTKLLATVNGALNSTYDINTGTNASGSPSSWAMKLIPSTNLTSSNILNGYGSYSVVPSSYVKVATMVPTTTITNPTSLEATYRVNIASTQPAGTYNGKVRYVMVNPASEIPLGPRDCAANTICYWPNASEVADSMGDQGINSSTTSVTLWASNFQRPGYGFAGWSDAYDYVVNVGSESNPDARIYGPNEDIEFTTGQYSGLNGGLSLYAIWVESEGYLQNWTGCSSLGQGKVTALTDQRDNDTYAVAKLADGKCWMIENLRLDNTNSDNTTGALSQGYGGVFAGLAEPEASWGTNTGYTSANSLYYINYQEGTSSINVGNVYMMPRYNNRNTSASTNITNMTYVAQNVYSYGNYYTHPAAVASTSYVSSGELNSSLCPIGWNIPRGGNKASENTNDFWNLIVINLNNNSKPVNYNDSTEPYYSTLSGESEMYGSLRSFPNNFLFAGELNSTSRGYYWSSTFKTSSYAYILSFGSYNNDYVLYPGTEDGFSFSGYPVRCLASS